MEQAGGASRLTNVANRCQKSLAVSLPEYLKLTELPLSVIGACGWTLGAFAHPCQTLNALAIARHPAPLRPNRSADTLHPEIVPRTSSRISVAAPLLSWKKSATDIAKSKTNLSSLSDVNKCKPSPAGSGFRSYAGDRRQPYPYEPSTPDVRDSSAEERGRVC